MTEELISFETAELAKEAGASKFIANHCYDPDSRACS